MDRVIKVPQIGEAIHSVNIVKYLKAVGDPVGLDEPVVALETSKAILEIESPFAGTIKEFRFPEGKSVPIGEEIIVLSCAGIQKPEVEESVFVKNRAFRAPDRQIPARNGALSPREKHRQVSGDVSLPRRITAAEKERGDFIDMPIRATQARLNQFLAASARQVIAANIQMPCNEVSLQAFRQTLRQAGNKIIPSRLEIITWAVATALRKHVLFRSCLMNETQLRQYQNPALGIAVALPEDNLATAVVRNVFDQDFYPFVKSMRARVEEARQRDYMPDYHCLTISDLSSYGVTQAVPVVVYPAVATLFVGRPDKHAMEKGVFHFSLSFDHRIANGAAAAAFLETVCRSLRDVPALVGERLPRGQAAE